MSLTFSHLLHSYESNNEYSNPIYIKTQVVHKGITFNNKNIKIILGCIPATYFPTLNFRINVLQSDKL